jgi:hypothetical protein
LAIAFGHGIDVGQAALSLQTEMVVVVLKAFETPVILRRNARRCSAWPTDDAHRKRRRDGDGDQYSARSKNRTARREDVFLMGFEFTGERTRAQLEAIAIAATRRVSICEPLVPCRDATRVSRSRAATFRIDKPQSAN